MPLVNYRLLFPVKPVGTPAMRLSRVRLTVRTMMAGVVLLAILFALENARQQRATRKLRASYETRASISRSRARALRDAYENGTGVVFAFPHGPVFASTRPLRLKWAQYYESLSRK